MKLPVTLFHLLRRWLLALTGRGYDRSASMNNLHHKLSYRLHRLLPAFGITDVQRVALPDAVAGQTPRWMYVRAEDGGVAHQLIVYKEYEPYESQLVAERLKPGMTVYNIGANLGYYVLLASGRVGPQGKVIAFEPAPQNLELLRRTIAESGLTNVVLREQAVGAERTTAALALSPSNSGDHQLRQVVGREHVLVTVTSVEECIAEGLAEPDVIILDVQGAELEVLDGMNSVLSSSRPLTIFTEFWPAGLEDREPGGARRFLELLESNGFSISVIDEAHNTIQRTDIQTILRSTVGHNEKNLLCVRD